MVCKIKGDGVKNLDKLTREKYTNDLDWFICFSSIASGFGSAGQSNYAFANSIIDRVIEQRLNDRVPGKSDNFFNCYISVA